MKDPLFLSRWDEPNLRYQDDQRITSRVNPKGYRWVGNYYKGTYWMFVEDMHNGIMPFLHVVRRGTPSPLSARIEPVNLDLGAMLANALGGERYERDLPEALCNFIRTETQTLFTYGRVCFEITMKKGADGKITEFDFEDVFPLSLKKFFGRYFQVVPWWVACHANVKVGVKKIPEKNIFVMSFPKVLGGRRRYVSVIKNLVRVGESLFPKFHIEALQQEKNTGFDLKKYVKDKYIETAQVTRTFGWHQRKLPDNEVLEYYTVHRHLQFEYSQAIIRESFVAAINSALKNSMLGFDEQLIVTGVPTSEQIKQEMVLLEKGDLSFSEQYKRISV